MMITGFDIEPISFNDDTYTHVDVASGATKHYLEDSERFYRYWVAQINGATMIPMERGKNGEPIYYTASVTSAIRTSFAQSNYREVKFGAYPESETLHIYHSSSLREKQYKRLLEKIERNNKKL
jgi:effector-binding domain-containing protein